MNTHGRESTPDPTPPDDSSTNRRTAADATPSGEHEESTTADKPQADMSRAESVDAFNNADMKKATDALASERSESDGGLSSGPVHSESAADEATVEFTDDSPDGELTLTGSVIAFRDSNAADTPTLPGVPSDGSETQDGMLARTIGLDSYLDPCLVRNWRFGRILEAIHPALKRPAWIIVLDSPHADSMEIRDAFIDQVRSAAAIESPHVQNEVWEAVVDGETVFVVLEPPRGRAILGYGPRSKNERRKAWFFPNRELAGLMLNSIDGLASIQAEGLRFRADRESLREEGEPATAFLVGALGLLIETPDSDNDVESQSRAQAHLEDIRQFGSVWRQFICETEQTDITSSAQGTAQDCFDDLRRKNTEISPAIAASVADMLTAEPGRKFDWSALRERLRRRSKRGVKRVNRLRRISTLATDLLLQAIIFVSLWAILRFRREYIVFDLEAASALALVAVGTGYNFCEVMYGWTFGRRFRGIVLVDRSGEVPPRARRLQRFAIRHAMFWLVAFFTRLYLGSDVTVTWWLFCSLIVGSIANYVTAYLTPSRLPFHDHLTGITLATDDTITERVAEIDHGAGYGVPVDATSGPSDEGDTGQRLGNFALQAELGRGGMGTVYAARDPNLQRDVAIKVISGRLATETAARKRFEREAQLGALVSHPNIAKVYGVGEESRSPYVVMERVRGVSLRELVRQEGPIRLPDAWDYVTQAAMGLAEASRLGIVHRDVKPANLMVDENRIVKVMDFGVSKLDTDSKTQDQVHAETPATGNVARSAQQPEQRQTGDGRDETGRARADSRVHDSSVRESAPDEGAPLDAVLEATGAETLTHQGTLIGTPMFMSPEQCRAEPVDARSDIYSLGTTLYYLLTGKPPYHGATPRELFKQQADRTLPELRGKIPGLTRAQSKVIKKMTAKSPSTRYQDYSTLINDLRLAAPRLATPATLARRFFAQLMTWALIACVLAITEVVLEQLFGVSDEWIERLGVALVLTVCAASIWSYGTTPGKWLLSLRVRRTNGRGISLERAIARLALILPSGVVGYLTDDEVLGGIALVVTLCFWLVSCLRIVSGRPSLHDSWTDTRVVRIYE